MRVSWPSGPDRGLRSGGMADAQRPGSWSPSPRRNPNRWQEDQLAFRREYARDPTAFARTPVSFRWWTRRGLLPLGLVWLVDWVVRLVRGTTPARLVAVYRPDAPPSTRPFLCFEVFDEAFGPAQSGEGHGVLVGEPVANGTLLLEVDDQVILSPLEPDD